MNNTYLKLHKTLRIQRACRRNLVLPRKLVGKAGALGCVAQRPSAAASPPCSSVHPHHLPPGVVPSCREFLKALESVSSARPPPKILIPPIGVHPVTVPQHFCCTFIFRSKAQVLLLVVHISSTILREEKVTVR